MDYLSTIVSAALLTFVVVYAIGMYKRLARLERRVDALQKLVRETEATRDGR